MVLGDASRARDRLIAHLHGLQDHFGVLTARHLVALAEEMRLALAEVYEVATFYAHFDVARDSDAVPPELTVRVCDSLSCALAGAPALLHDLPDVLGKDVRVMRAPCMGRCDTAPCAAVGRYHVDAATTDAVAGAVGNRRTQPAIPDYQSLDDYRSQGGHAVLAACRAGARTVEQVLSELTAADLRGLGGAGFPAARKWEFVRAAAKPRFVTINADESEPGTFKDRHYLEREPHRVLEGALIAAWAVEAEAVHIYLRDEYPAVREILRREIAALDRAGLTPPAIELHRGAGAYICGEESAMLESIEGKRGLPRNRPPYVAEVGLFDRPTLVHNVETVYWIREIVENGGAAFAVRGADGHKGWRSYSVSGRVNAPGVKRAPAGITARKLIEEYCGGMLDGHRLKAYLPGGASGGILPARLADLPLDFGSLEPHGCFIGSHALIVLSHQDSVREAALNLMRFFEDESCGQCTPCRVGTEKAVKLMQAPVWDEPLLHELSTVMREASICGLGQAAPNPLDCVLKYFPQEVDEHD